MADKRGHSKTFKTPPHILGFDKFLFNPQKKITSSGPNKGQEFDEYGATLIFPITTPKQLFEKAIMEACLDAKWGDEQKIIELIKGGMIKSPFLAGDGKEARNKETGNLHPGMGPNVWFIRTNTRQAPVIRWKSETIPATKDEVYAGCQCFSAINAYTWVGETGKGVSFGLSYMQKMADGEKLYSGSTVKASDYFEKIEDNGDAPDVGSGGAGNLFG